MRSPHRHVLRDGILVPRWVAGTVMFVALYFLGTLLLKEPEWIVQRLDTVDGSKAAVLKRVTYTAPQFKIQTRTGRFWHTLYTSEPITTGLHEDLRERLLWSDNGQRLYFSQQGVLIWGFDFGRNSTLPPQILAEDQKTLANRIAR